MKRFTTINIIISILFLLFSYVLSYYYDHYIDDIKRKFYYYDKVLNKKVDLVNIGSSHTRYGLKFEKEKGLNLASISQNFYYDFELLKKYENKINEGSIVIIPISIMSFYVADTSKIDQNYIGILNKKRIKSIKNVNYFLKRYFSIYFPPTRILGIISHYKKNKFDILDGYHKETLSLEEMKKEAIKTAKAHTDIKVINMENKFREMLKYIERKKWQPIFITTPFSYLYNEEIEKISKNAYEERIYKNIKMIEKKMGKSYIYLDYSHDKRFENNLEFFFDDDHLNEKGAEYFTKILLEDIRALKLGNKK